MANDTAGRALAKGGKGLISLISGWDSLTTHIPEDAIRNGLEGLRLCRDELVDWINFNEQEYKRNLVHSTATFELLILCWRSGQLSPIHDHGNSACGLLVVEGEATEVVFELNSRRLLAPSQTRCVQAGSCVISRGSDIHQVANLDPAGRDLITLHVYSPPLSAFRTYRVDMAAPPVPDHHITFPPLPISARRRSRSPRVRFDPDL
jgi:cysteine dioxygenase